MDLAALAQRKGAPRFAAIPPDVLAVLNRGLLPTVNLVEWLAIDLPGLARHVASDIGLDPQHEVLADALAMLDAVKPLRRHPVIARALYAMTAQQPDPDRHADALARHPSDVARGWAAHWVGMGGLPLAGQLASVRRFAADAHFGVRELAWSVVRDAVIAELDHALVLLQPWVREADPHLRRFASELTRPRGVWRAQIEGLKAEPWRALPLLEPLRADPDRYVQNSVANWLNDASKSQPAWVIALAERWLRESPGAHTRYIVQRALRTLRRDGAAVAGTTD